jgi:poly-gamma-glutamate capsule biosynthesis protein CapA/YwtB (metallophosphatase superfamily)
MAGDVLLHTQVVRSACSGSLRRNAQCDFARLLAPTAPLVSAADLAICHLEVPIAAPRNQVTGYPVFGAPLAIIPALKSTGWDRCSTASNHSYDQKREGINATLNALDENGLGHNGSARTEAEANANTIFTSNGIRIAHRSYTYGLNGFRLPKNEPWRVNLLSAQTIIADAAKAKAAGAEIVLVSLHWGEQYVINPSKQQLRLADAITKSGLVDLIIGHHPHVVQPIRKVNNRWVVFSLGNHISSQRGSKGRPPSTQDGLMVNVTFREGPANTFTAEQPIGHATWVQPGSYRVFVVDDAIDQPNVSPATRAALTQSRRRTSKVVGSFLQSEPAATK